MNRQRNESMKSFVFDDFLIRFTILPQLIFNLPCKDSKQQFINFKNLTWFVVFGCRRSLLPALKIHFNDISEVKFLQRLIRSNVSLKLQPMPRQWQEWKDSSPFWRIFERKRKKEKRDFLLIIFVLRQRCAYCCWSRELHIKYKTGVT